MEKAKTFFKRNGLLLKQENFEKEISSVLYAKTIKEQGRHILDFMILEHVQLQTCS